MRSVPSFLFGVIGALFFGVRSGFAADPIAPLRTPPVPHTESDFIQFGTAVTVESRLPGGSVCPVNAVAPCILGSGGGFALRVGLRKATVWYGGVAYEFSRQNASNLINLPILQQARLELRRYLTAETRGAPYVSAAIGGVGYGDEWAIASFGPLASVGVGVTWEVTPEVFIGFSPAYRLIYLRSWVDNAGQERPSSFVHFLGLEFTFESRSRLPRYLPLRHES